MKYAKLRWRRVAKRTFELEDGTRFRLGAKVPDEVLDTIEQLPQDYLDLGNASADALHDVREAKKVAQYWEDQFTDLATKVSAIGGKDKDELLVILQRDMETALNLTNRLLYASGAQPGGEFYEGIAALLRKYGMSPTPAPASGPLNNPLLNDVVLAAEEARYADVPRVTRIYNDDTGTLHVEAEDEHFDYHVHEWRDPEYDAEDDGLSREDAPR